MAKSILLSDIISQSFAISSVPSRDSACLHLQQRRTLAVNFDRIAASIYTYISTRVPILLPQLVVICSPEIVQPNFIQFKLSSFTFREVNRKAKAKEICQGSSLMNF